MPSSTRCRIGTEGVYVVSSVFKHADKGLDAEPVRVSGKLSVAALEHVCRPEPIGDQHLKALPGEASLYAHVRPGGIAREEALDELRSGEFTILVARPPCDKFVVAVQRGREDPVEVVLVDVGVGVPEHLPGQYRRA